jgi:hypothetical protein
MSNDEPTFQGLPDEELDAESPPDDQLSPSDLDDIVLYTVDWSVQSILERIGNAFDINPTFQRRDAWTTPRKSAYIESLLLGLPVPQIVLAEDKQKGRFIVLDGKQRLLTLKQFAAPTADFRSFKLRGMKFARELEGLTFAEIEGSLTQSEYAATFLSQPVRTVVVRNWGKAAVLYEVFIRLNQNSLPLSPQELRQALFPSSFTRWVNSTSANSAQLHRARRSKGVDFRMRDAEMLLRFIAWKEDFERYRGNLRQFLDDACIRGQEKWDDVGQKHFDDLAESCDSAVERTFEVFGDDAFLRYEEGSYNRRFNIAVFDLMSVVFSDPAVTEEVVAAAGGAFKQEFQRLCTEDETFRRSITATTKSVEAVRERFLTYASAIESVIGARLSITDSVEKLQVKSE